MDLVAEFGSIDIYLFDQILRGRIRADMEILDAGCGGGRNAHYLVRAGARVVGVDLAPSSRFPSTRRARADVRDLPFPDERFDAVLSSAVLHFLPDEAAWQTAVTEMWRVLRPGGVFFARLASSIGIEDRITPLGDRRYRVPDGSERLLADEALLLGAGERIGGELLDPIKTTNVQNLRAMTTWVLGKCGPRGEGRAGEHTRR